MSMNIFDTIEKLITEHGSAAILRERLDFAKQQFAQLEAEVVELRNARAEIAAFLRIEKEAHTKTRDNYDALVALHSEEIRIVDGIEFRRGKRTSGCWIAFCPACHVPADTSRVYVRCSVVNCGWTVLIPNADLKSVIQKL